MARVKPKSLRRPRQGKVSLAVGDVVSWGSAQTIGVVQAIRVIDSGKIVQAFCGNGADVVLTIGDGVGTAYVHAEEGLITKLEADQAKALVNQGTLKEVR